jgi:hypothetical protein
MHAGGEPTAVDACALGGFVRVHALRKNVPMRLMVRTTAFDTTESSRLAGRSYLTPGEMHILQEFSTQPLPAIDVFRDSSGMLESSLRFESVGRAAAVDVFTAKVARNANAGKPEPWHGSMKMVSIPTEVLLLDLIVPRGWTDPAMVRTSTHGNPFLMESLPKRVPDFELPVKEVAEYLGSDLGLLETPDVPRYPEMVRSVLGELGWTETTFDIYRVRVHYPIMHSLVHLRVDTVLSLPEGPQETH